MDVVSLSIAEATASACGAAASAQSVSAGRPFFIVIGTAHASSAPAAKSASSAYAATSPVMSSTLASITTCVAAPASPPAISATGAVPSTARSRFGRSASSFWPPPNPTRSGAKVGHRSNREAIVATMAAPVGVTNSKSTSVAYVGTPRRHSTVAGGGSGRIPWRACTKPRPIGNGEATTSAPRCAMHAAAPTMSTIASTAPTSWKWTSSSGILWTAASASPSRRKMRRARSFTRGASGASVSMASISRKVRSGCGASRWTSNEVATIPERWTCPRWM